MNEKEGRSLFNGLTYIWFAKTNGKTKWNFSFDFLSNRSQTTKDGHINTTEISSMTGEKLNKMSPFITTSKYHKVLQSITSNVVDITL